MVIQLITRSRLVHPRRICGPRTPRMDQPRPSDQLDDHLTRCVKRCFLACLHESPCHADRNALSIPTCRRAVKYARTGGATILAFGVVGQVPSRDLIVLRPMNGVALPVNWFV